MVNKLILFDWGNIVESHTTGYSCLDAWDDVFKACGYKGNEKASGLAEEYKFTRIQTVEEFEVAYNKMAQKYNFKTTYAEFIKIYKEIFDKIDFYEDVSQYEKSLKDKCSIGIFSNLNVFDKERLDRQVNLSEYDYVFLSFELGCKKPERIIYEKVNESIPFSPENVLFIDDKQENIDEAKSVGWNALRATGLELDKIKKYCENFINGNNLENL